MLNSLFKPTIFVEFFLVAITLCGTSLQIILYDDFGKIMTAFLHVVAALTDVAIYSYCGQKVLDSGLAVSDGLYELDKKYLLVIMMSQKQLKFDTGLFDASLDTLSILLSRTLSFITLLKSFFVGTN